MPGEQSADGYLERDVELPLKVKHGALLWRQLLDGRRRYQEGAGELVAPELLRGAPGGGSGRPPPASPPVEMKSVPELVADTKAETLPGERGFHLGWGIGPPSS